jgi:hypothetical protein
MKKRTTLLLAFFLLTAFNLVIYLKRDHFAYSPETSATLLYAACESNCTKKWMQLISDFPEEQLRQASDILDNSIQLAETNTTEKILLIGNFIRTHFHEQHGKPSSLISSGTPFEQYKILSQNSSEKLWCGNYANIFAWFCWSKGITTRIIEIIKPGDHHVVNECYVPEKKKWAMVDIGNNLLLVEDSLQEPLHTLDILKKVEDSSILSIYTSVQDSIKQDRLDSKIFPGKKHFQKKHSLHYYKQVNTNAVYSTGQKLKRYLLPVSWYSIYHPDGRSQSNFSYVLKVFFICAWLITIFGLLRLFLFHRK